MSRKVEMILEYQNYIETAPVPPKALYSSACSSDSITIDSWRDIWIKNITANHAKFGSFKEHSMGKLWGANQYKPCIVVGSGPSLGVNGDALKDRGGICAVSCLHNYHFFEDRGIDIDYYVSLDAGPVVLEEISEGGTKTEAEYWASTKNKKLIAFIGSDPRLFEKWLGEVYLYTAPVPDQAFLDASNKLETFDCLVSTGGNVLGASLYIAKGILGSSVIAYMGADFSFGYNTGTGHKFHSWDSKYDAKLGHVQRGVDCYGNKVLTWPSYYNFKNWFDWVAIKIPGIYFNCTEGGMLGAYPEGNLMCIQQKPIKDFLAMLRMNENLKNQCEHPEVPDKRLLF